jgi:hypothetical protein
LELARAADSVITQRNPDVAATFALAEKVARAQDGLLHFGQFLGQALAKRIRERAEQGEGDVRSVELWEQTAGRFARAVGVHMEPRQTVMSAAFAIANAKQRGAI